MKIALKKMKPMKKHIIAYFIKIAVISFAIVEHFPVRLYEAKLTGIND